MKKAVGITLLALLVLLPLCLCGCPEEKPSGPSTADVDPLSTSYQSGYRAGFDTGYTAGGFDRDRQREKNTTQPTPQGDHDDDYLVGFSDGYIEGYDKGYSGEKIDEPEYQRGYERGFDQGADLAFSDYKRGTVNEGAVIFTVLGNSYYRRGFARGSKDGYEYGMERAMKGYRWSDDWYADYTAGEESGSDGGKEWYEDDDEESQDEDAEKAAVLDHLDGLYQCEAEFDPHYTYSLIIKKDHTQFEMDMVPKGGYVVVFKETGRCEVDEGGMALTLFPSQLHEDRPDELPTNPTYKIRIDSSDGSYSIELVDEAGKVWD